jgi:type III pantothenate kinase
MLTIDIGNSRVKWVLFEGDSVQAHDAFVYDKNNLADQLMQAGVPLRGQPVWLSNVAGEEIASQVSQILDEQSCLDYQFATTRAQQCGVRNGYRQPQQLGVDRWLAMLAAFHLPQRATSQSLCVVDCGTALTLDVLDATGQHLGGYIAPGLTTMQEMLNQKLAHIDIAPADPGSVKVPADNTADGIARGCAQVLLGGIRQMLEDSLPANEKPCIVLSGGDAQWVQDGLKLVAEAVYEPLLVNKGLRLVAEEYRLTAD